LCKSKISNDSWFFYLATTHLDTPPAPTPPLTPHFQLLPTMSDVVRFTNGYIALSDGTVSFPPTLINVHPFTSRRSKPTCTSQALPGSSSRGSKASTNRHNPPPRRSTWGATFWLPVSSRAAQRGIKLVQPVSTIRRMTSSNPAIYLSSPPSGSCSESSEKSTP
jgi:hypothetical protein